MIKRMYVRMSVCMHQCLHWIETKRRDGQLHWSGLKVVHTAHSKTIDAIGCQPRGAAVEEHAGGSNHREGEGSASARVQMQPWRVRAAAAACAKTMNLFHFLNADAILKRLHWF